MWSLTQYDKLVWLDGDSIIMQNIDELFKYSELSAAQDYVGKKLIPDKICGGLMVIEPSEQRYSDLIALLYKDTSKIWYNGEQELVNFYYDQKGKITILEPHWSTFIYPGCPPVSSQKVGHWTHW